MPCVPHIQPRLCVTNQFITTIFFNFVQYNKDIIVEHLRSSVTSKYNFKLCTPYKHRPAVQKKTQLESKFTHYFNHH